MAERGSAAREAGAQKAEQTTARRPTEAKAERAATSKLYGDLMLAAHGGGVPLPAGERAWFEPRLGADLGGVRMHGGAEAESVAEAQGAAAVTSGGHVFLPPSAPAAGTPRGDRLLGHELAHAAQFARGGGGGGGDGAAALEREADVAGGAAALGAAVPVRGGASAAAGPLGRRKDDDQRSDMAGWHPAQGSFLLAAIGDKVFLFPARGMVYEPDFALALPFVPAMPMPAAAQDVGAFLNLPSVGAGGTRIISVGGQTALLLDAGSDTRGVSSIVFTGQLQAALAGMGVNDIGQVRIIHVHADHVNKIPDVMTAFPNAELVVPETYMTGTVFPPLQKALDAVRATRGAGWSPTIARDLGESAVSRIVFQANGYVFEQVALRSALADVAKNPNKASYVCRATRVQDGAAVVILGDFPLSAIPELRDGMNRDRPGSFDTFWEGVTTIVEHHASAMKEADVNGLLEVANRTLFKTGRLTIAVQTNVTTARAPEVAARQQTMELWQRMGIDVQAVGMPVQGAAPSSVTATRDAATTTGPDVVAQTPVPSAQTQALARLQRLISARSILELWRPLLTARADDPKAVEDLFTSYDNSLVALRAQLATAAETAARVRTAGPIAPGGATRDYSAAASSEGATYQAALTSLAAPTPIETEIGEQGFAVLEQLPKRTAEQISAQAAIELNVKAGNYDEAFQKMVAQIDPMTRDSILYNARGEALPKGEAFQRLTAQYITASMLPQMDMNAPASAAHLSPPARVGARGAAIVLLVQQGLDLYGQIKDSMAMAEQTNLRRNVMPFIRRLAFWTELGARPAVVGVDDDWDQWSPNYERDYDDVMAHLDDWDAIYIEDEAGRPCLSEQDYFRIAAHLAFYVRNFDEFATLFNNSAQDAVKWKAPTDDSGWTHATWFVKVAKYDTSGSNSVSERWVYDDKLTKLMNAFAGRIIANTDELLGLQEQGKELPGEDSRLGGFEKEAPPKGAKRAHFRRWWDNGKTTVYTYRARGDMPEESGTKLSNDVTWWSPPVFWVHDQDDEYTRVSGADYNTYAVLRNLANEEYEARAGEQGNYTATTRVANQGGMVWVKTSKLEIEP